MHDDSFDAAAALFVDLVARVPADAWERPALGAWDVRALVGHTSRALATVLAYLDEPAERAEVGSAAAYFAAATGQAATGGAAAAAAVEERGRAAGRALGDDPLTAVRDLRERALARLAQADPDDLLTTVAGGMRVRDYLPTRVLELVVHSRDLARALDLPLDVPDDLLRSVARLVADVAVATGRGPVVLDALLGRGELPPGFSLV